MLDALNHHHHNKSLKFTQDNLVLPVSHDVTDDQLNNFHTPVEIMDTDHQRRYVHN